MYIVLAKAFNLFSLQFIIEKIAGYGVEEEEFFFFRQEEFEQLFDEFVTLSFGFSLDILRHLIPVVARFFTLPIDDHIPSAANAHNLSPFKVETIILTPS